MQEYQAVLSASIQAPIETVFDRLADHNRMGEWLDADIHRTKDATAAGEGVNGTGSVRTLRILGLLDFDETVVRCEKPRALEYEITRGSPLKNHHGAITLKQDGNMTQIEWDIRFDMAIPLAGHLVALLLKMAVGRGLQKLKGQLES